MSALEEALTALAAAPKRWLVTGAAGFIGSNLVEALLRHNQSVVGLDNLSTGSRRNLDQVLGKLLTPARDRFLFIEGDIRDVKICKRACEGIDFVLHQAALGSVPRSVSEPLLVHEINVDGFINMLVSARDQQVRRFVYASSSAVYGDNPRLPKIEIETGRALSPYGATKQINELYADVFSRCYAMPAVGLRYFNVFGPRQDPNGPYAAVIPRWFQAMLRGQPVTIFGDGTQSRDFCHVANVVQANILAAIGPAGVPAHEVFNVAAGARSTLLELFEMLRKRLLPDCPHLTHCQPRHEPARAGDIAHSHADISAARLRLRYEPTHTLSSGLDDALSWYREELG